MSDQCYCGQMAAGHSNWEWQQHENTAPAMVTTNNNMATDNYIRQFEEAYSASYSNMEDKFSGQCKPPQSSPSKSYFSYQSLSPAYYQGSSPTKHQVYTIPSDDHQVQTSQHQQMSYVGSYTSDVTQDYIQPCHIFQVRFYFYISRRRHFIKYFQMDHEQPMANVDFEYKNQGGPMHYPTSPSSALSISSSQEFSHSQHPPPLFSQENPQSSTSSLHHMGQESRDGRLKNFKS